MSIVQSLIDNFFEYLLVIVNAPLQPLFGLVQNLISEPVNISIFGSLWAIMVYILSLFYGLLLLYAGFNFIISGHDIVKRENAKTWLRNVMVMTVLIQASFFLYFLVVEISSLLTTGVLGLIDPNFFLFTFDNFVNIGLEFIFGITYIFTLLLTTILLTVRYLIVSIGVVLMPIAIFFYFIPPLNSYGRLILNFVGVCIFITFLDAIVLLAGSKLIGLALFQNFKILVVISSFSLANLLMSYAMFFAIARSALNTAIGVKGKVGVLKALVGA